MDYHYAPEENNIDTYKVTPAKTIKLIFRSIFYFLILLTYGLFMMRFFVSCDVDLVSTPRFSDTARELYSENPEAFEYYKVVTEETRNDDRTLILKNVVYTPTAKELELGIKFDKEIADGHTGDVLTYKLSDSKGNEYEIVSRYTQSRYDYGYARISFGGVEFDISRNIVTYITSMANESNYEFYESEVDETDSEENEDPNNIKYTLYVYYDDQLIDSFLVYDDDIYLIEDEFELN